MPLPLRDLGFWPCLKEDTTYLRSPNRTRRWQFRTWAAIKYGAVDNKITSGDEFMWRARYSGKTIFTV